MNERCHNSLNLLNEFLQFTAHIESAQILTNFVSYSIRVTTHIAPEVPGRDWLILRRYSEFDTLNRQLACYGLDLTLPAKKVFGNLDRDFIADRQNGLQVFMDIILADRILSSCPATLAFFHSESVKFDHQERALQYISMEFRCDSPWEVVQPCSEMGVRLRKTYIVVRSKESIIPGALYLACWSDFGTDSTLQTNQLTKVLRSLHTLKHPNILPIDVVNMNNNGCYIIRSLSEHGSLKDFISKIKPQNSALKKYGPLKRGLKLPLETIRVFSRQILEALRFIHAKGWPYGHLHSRNIVVLRPDLCALTDLENSFLGHSAQLRVLFLQLHRKMSLEELDVYCFGRCLYEMVFGYSLKRHTLDGEEINCSADIRSILERLLTSEGIKEGIPSVDSLLEISFFSIAPAKALEKPSWKIPRDVREMISEVSSLTLQSLADDSALVRATRQRRNTEIRLQEEKRQRKHRDRRRRPHTVVNDTRGAAVGDPDMTFRQSNKKPLPQSIQSTSNTSLPAQSTNGLPEPSPTASVVTDETSSSTDGVVVSSGRSGNTEVSSLLGSINNFNKNLLKKTKVSADRSAPHL